MMLIRKRSTDAVISGAAHSPGAFRRLTALALGGGRCRRFRCAHDQLLFCERGHWAAWNGPVPVRCANS